MVENIIRTSEIDEAIGHLEDILPKIQELELKQSGGWISVEDRFPEEIKRVQTIDGSGCYRKLHICDSEWLDDDGNECF